MELEFFTVYTFTMWKVIATLSMADRTRKVPEIIIMINFHLLFPYCNFAQNIHSLGQVSLTKRRNWSGCKMWYVPCTLSRSDTLAKGIIIIINYCRINCCCKLLTRRPCSDQHRAPLLAPLTWPRHLYLSLLRVTFCFFFTQSLAESFLFLHDF